MRAKTSRHPSRRASSSFAWRYHGCAGCFAPVRSPTRHRRAGVFVNAATHSEGIALRITPPKKSVEMTGSPKFPRNPLAATPMFLRPRKNRTELAFTLRPTRLRVRERSQLLRIDFRGSITWLSDSLSTLRSSGLPRYHARLACGCRLNSAARASHPPGFIERFQLCFSITSLPPLASFLGAIPVPAFSVA
jgi:hypothetical protein